MQLTTPESLLLAAVSGESTQDRTDREMLTPWVKFLWEAYRQCLDLLRNNARVERLYQVKPHGNFLLVEDTSDIVHAFLS